MAAKTTDRVVSLPVTIDGVPDDLVVHLGLIRAIQFRLGRVELITTDDRAFVLRVSTVAEALTLLDRASNEGVWTRAAWLVTGVLLAVSWDWWMPVLEPFVAAHLR